MYGVMRKSQFAVSLPEPLAEAIVGEAVRTSVHTSEVIAQALAEAFPDFVARRMRVDLEAITPERQP
jgi:hypothetical protein